MIASAREVLQAFDALPPVDQRQVATEILRRTTDYGDLSGTALDALADELFRRYDAEEAARGDSAR